MYSCCAQIGWDEKPRRTNVTERCEIDNSTEYYLRVLGILAFICQGKNNAHGDNCPT